MPASLNRPPSPREFRALMENPLLYNSYMVKGKRLLTTIRDALEERPPFSYKAVAINNEDYEDLLLCFRIAMNVDEFGTKQFFRNLKADVYLRADGVKILQGAEVPRGTLRFFEDAPADNWALDFIGRCDYTTMQVVPADIAGHSKITLRYKTIRVPPPNRPLPPGYRLLSAGISHHPEGDWKIVVEVHNDNLSAVTEASWRDVFPLVV